VGAKREAMEEAGLQATLNGVLRVEHGIGPRGCRFRVIFSGVPTVPDAPLKDEPDDETYGAEWYVHVCVCALMRNAPDSGGLVHLCS
jgi:8-oxo-dGTP pyrophosphatase MutT (NUDIX family)